MKYFLGVVCMTAFLLVSGCSSDPVYATPAMMTPHKDQPVSYAGADLAERVPLANDGISEKRTAEGQLALTLKFTNVGHYPESIMVRVQFLEQDGSPLDNDKEERGLIIQPEGASEQYTFLSKTLKAAKYSVMVLKENGGPPAQE